jgi:hypothetical protein
MTLESLKQDWRKLGAFHVAWAIAFWIGGAVLILTDVIHSGAPTLQLYVLALGALIHALGVSQFGEHMSSIRRVAGFYRLTCQSWRHCIGWGVVGGICDVALTAGLFMLYPFLPDVGSGWAVAIMMAILLLPAYPVFAALVYVRTRTITP